LLHTAAGAVEITPAFLYLIDRIQVGDYVIWGNPAHEPQDWTIEVVTAVTNTEVDTRLKRFARSYKAGIDLGKSLDSRDKFRILDIFPWDRDEADVYAHLSRVFRVAPGDQVTWCFHPGDPYRMTEPVVDVQGDEIITPTKRFFRWSAAEMDLPQPEAAWICDVSQALEPDRQVH
jgi:hypothetical protein